MLSPMSYFPCLNKICNIILLDCDLPCNGFFIINGKEIIGDVFSMKASFHESKSNEETSTI